MVRVLVGSGVGSGPAVDVRVAWTVAPVVVPLAHTLKMHLWSVPVVVSYICTYKHIHTYICMYDQSHIITHSSLSHSATVHGA